MLELNHIYNMDCMEGMRQIPDKYFELAIVSNSIKPFGGTLNIGEVARTCFKRGIIRREHTTDLRKMDSGLTRYLGLIGNCFAKFKDTRMVLNALLIVIRTAQSIHAKIKGFGHIAIEKITNFAGIKADKREHINFAIIVSLGIVFAVAFDIKNICLGVFRSLRNYARGGCGFNLNTQKAFSVIHKNVIRKPLLTRESNKAFHDKVCTNKILASLANLQLVTKSHNITSDTLYHKYVEVSRASAKAAA